MEKALWNDKLVFASEIAENYTFEKAIKLASSDKSLRCPDPECKNPILHYCHGKIKNAYFSHYQNANCDYAEFDKSNTIVIRNVRHTLYNHFKEKGYSLQIEVKILPHHYTHLLFETSDHKKIAVEIGNKNFSARKIDSLTNEYNNNKIAVKWIVIEDIDLTIKENQTYFLNRYLLNESKNKDLLIVTPDCSQIAQYKIDPNKYTYNERCIKSENYPESYVEVSDLNALILDENNELSLNGYHYRYEAWLKKKKNAFDKKVKELDEESKSILKQIHQNALRKQSLYRQKQIKQK